MKKLLILLLIISFTLGITACAKNDTATADQKETRTPTVSETEAAPPTAAAPTDAPEATAALTQTIKVFLPHMIQMFPEHAH